MKPAYFPQANSTLSGGPVTEFSTTEDVSDLSVYKGDGEIISCWLPNPWERFRILFGKPVWLRVVTESTHSPVDVCGKRVFP